MTQVPINGNRTRAWRVIVAVLLTVIIPIIAWGLLQIVDFPKVYAEKGTVKSLAIEMDSHYNSLSQKMDRQYESQMESISEINRYLRGLNNR